MCSAVGHRSRVGCAPWRELIDARKRYVDRLSDPTPEEVRTSAALEVSACLCTRSSLS